MKNCHINTPATFTGNASNDALLIWLKEAHYRSERKGVKRDDILHQTHGTRTRDNTIHLSHDYRVGGQKSAGKNATILTNPILDDL